MFCDFIVDSKTTSFQDFFYDKLSVKYTPSFKITDIS